MPLSTRTVSPVDLSVNRIPKSIGRDELQCVANGTLANLIRQLSSLSKNAEQIFREVHREVLKIDHKATTLFLRVERLAQKVAQPGFTRAESGGLEENHLRKAFKSTNIIDQHSLNRQTLPTFIYELHQKCEPPPELNSLNPYRDDSKSALCFYTDPDYFFNLWKEEMLKESGRSGGGGSGANKSPSRTRRKSRVPNTQLQYQAGGRQPYNHQAGMQANVLVNHYSTMAVSATQNLGRGIANGKSHEQLLNFPAEYQAPQHALNFNSRVVQAPPGMSLHATDARSTNQAFFHHQQQQEQYYQQQQQMLAQQQQATRQGYPYSSDGKHHNTADALGGSMAQRLAEMSINRTYQPAGGSDGGGSSQANTTTTATCQEPNFGGFLEEDEDDELPPPPPALSAHTMMTPPATGHASSSSLSSSMALSDNAMLQQQQFAKPTSQHHQVPTTTLQYLPSGGALDSDRQPHTMDGGTLSGSSAPPPPPPPPAPSGTGRSDPSGSFSSNLKPPDEASTPLQTTSTTAQSSGGDQVSSLLLEIRSGIKLKNVQRKEELAENRAAQDSTDVAAILRRRMEHVLGNGDDSSESSNGDADEWEE